MFRNPGQQANFHLCEGFYVTKLIENKKEIYPPSERLDRYLRTFNRSYRMPIEYDDLFSFRDSFPIYDANGQDTLWSTISYDPGSADHIYHGLLSMYAFMRTDGDLSATKHLVVDRVDLCLYGNTKPFRIRISNRLNDNFEYFYIKQADANRILGLELEHILSPNRIGFLVGGHTLIEEHIYGIPGDIFRDRYMDNEVVNRVRLGKEFVKFNERCLWRLLGDMHASNFVVDITMDFEMNFYRIRAIDFDQQSYESNFKVYCPQFFAQNSAFVKIATSSLPPASIEQYRKEERSVILRRMKSSRFRINSLFEIMSQEVIAPRANVIHLGEQLASHHNHDKFLDAHSMGDLVRLSLEHLNEVGPKGRFT